MSDDLNESDLQADRMSLPWPPGPRKSGPVATASVAARRPAAARRTGRRSIDRTPGPVLSNDESLNETVLALYRGATATGSRRFVEFAFETLDGLIRFDSAWWGQVVLRPQIQVLSIELHKVAPTIIEDYRSIQEKDLFAKALATHPGKTFMMSDLMSNEALYATPAWRLYGEKYKLHASMGTGQIEPGSMMCEFLTVWRHDARWPFSESDRRVKQTLMPHLIEARRINRLVELDSSDRDAPRMPWALCDRQGLLHDLQEDFSLLLREEWPNWRDARLPAPLIRAIRRGDDFRGRRLMIRAELHGPLRLVRARARDSLDTLGTREREVALAYAAGMTYQEIAAQKALAPATVRTHLQRIYRKLDVHSRTGLAKRLR